MWTFYEVVNIEKFKSTFGFDSMTNDQWEMLNVQ